MSKMKGKVVVVTGGRGALGGAVVDRLLERGALVHIPAFEASIEDATKDGVVIEAAVDLRDEGAVVDYYKRLPPLWSSVHLAGGFDMKPITETSLEDFRAQLDMNLVSSFLCCREAIRCMVAAGNGGRIVNVSARPALSPVAGMSAYSAAKAGVAALTRSLAEEVKADGILVNAIVPSMIDTARNRADMPDADHDAWPKAAEIADAIAFLVSPENRLTHGTLLPVYGSV